jgi:hypothetical protein
MSNYLSMTSLLTLEKIKGEEERVEDPARGIPQTKPFPLHG